MEENSSNKLSSSEKRDLVIQAAMQAIPYVGASLSAIYFGAKQERRFKRIENFYTELAVEINEIRDQIVSVHRQNKEALAAILEELNEKVEAVPLEEKEKRQFFKNYFKNTLRKPITNDFDKRKYFLQTLADMSLLECELLASINSQPGAVLVGNIKKPGTNQYAIVGAIGRLKVYGFLKSFQENFTVSAEDDNALQERVQPSGFGKEFVDFCLKA